MTNVNVDDAAGWFVWFASPASGCIVRVGTERYLVSAGHAFPKTGSRPSIAKSASRLQGYPLANHKYFRPAGEDLFVIHLPGNELGDGIRLVERPDPRVSALTLYAAGWGGGSAKILEIDQGRIPMSASLGDSGSGLFCWPGQEAHGIVLRKAEWSGYAELSVEKKLPPLGRQDWRNYGALLLDFPSLKRQPQAFPGEIGTLAEVDGRLELSPAPRD